MSIDITLLNGRNGNPVRIGDQRVGFFAINFTSAEAYATNGIDLTDKFKPWGISRANKLRKLRLNMPAEPAPGDYLQALAAYFPTIELDQASQKLKFFINDGNATVAAAEMTNAVVLDGVNIHIQVWGERS